jgi:hypothetical protein
MISTFSKMEGGKHSPSGMEISVPDYCMRFRITSRRIRVLITWTKRTRRAAEFGVEGQEAETSSNTVLHKGDKKVYSQYYFIPQVCSCRISSCFWGREHKPKLRLGQRGPWVTSLFRITQVTVKVYSYVCLLFRQVTRCKIAQLSSDSVVLVQHSTT